MNLECVTPGKYLFGEGVNQILVRLRDEVEESLSPMQRVKFRATNHSLVCIDESKGVYAIKEKEYQSFMRDQPIVE